MHPTAQQNCKYFFGCYGPWVEKLGQDIRVVEVGSFDMNGNLRGCCSLKCQYVGTDFAEGKGVDVVLTDPYILPFETESTDIVLCSSVYEHSEMFWLSFLEVMRILKPRGLFYLNVPSNGDLHRHPVDCWRFYPDTQRPWLRGPSGTA